MRVFIIVPCSGFFVLKKNRTCLPGEGVFSLLTFYKKGIRLPASSGEYFPACGLGRSKDRMKFRRKEVVSVAVKMVFDKCTFHGAEVRPANGNYPAKTQVEIVSGKFRAFLSSESIDFTSFPQEEPLKVVAIVSRIGGAKGFFVLTVENADIQPYVPVAATEEKKK